MDFTIGIMNGTTLVQNETDMLICSDSIVIDIIQGAYILVNETTSGTVFQGLYALYDMIGALHPTVFHCRKTVMDAVTESDIYFDSLDDIRRIIDNIVHNFSFMMDALLDVSSFFNSGERGQWIDGPYDAGFGIGRFFYYLIVDETTTLMIDPAEGAVMPLKFNWGENLVKWKAEDEAADLAEEEADDAESDEGSNPEF